MMTSPLPAFLLAQRFPRDFTWGVATSAFQIEGAAAADGKGESIWDRFCRAPGAIADASNGDVACDHYHRLDANLDLIAGLGVTAYRFSVSWPRVQPLGHGTWNEAGLRFYERLVDGLQARGISAHLTLNHWDLPQALQDRRPCRMKAAGARAKRCTTSWTTRVVWRAAWAAAAPASAPTTSPGSSPCCAVLGHQTGVFAPGYKSRTLALQVAHHLLLSHGLALQALRADGCTARLGIVLNLTPVFPATDSEADREQARIDDGTSIRWYCDPLFHGRYPADILDHYGADAPLVQPGDMTAIAQPLDFLGVNNYSRHMASATGPWDVKLGGLALTEMGWEIYPAGLTGLLLRLQRDYQPRSMLITENGC